MVVHARSEAPCSSSQCSRLTEPHVQETHHMRRKHIQYRQQGFTIPLLASITVQCVKRRAAPAVAYLCPAPRPSILSGSKLVSVIIPSFPRFLALG